MGLINWIFDVYQQARIENLHQQAAQARAEAMALRGTGGAIDTARLEEAIGELALAVKTVQRLTVEKGLCTTEEFQRKMREIDLEDGRADGLAPLR
jgi:hypothetical protein